MVSAMTGKKGRAGIVVLKFFRTVALVLMGWCALDVRKERRDVCWGCLF